MSIIYKKSDETQAEVTGVSTNLFQDSIMKPLKWSETFDRNSQDIPGELIKVAESLGFGKLYLPLHVDFEKYGTQKPPVKEVAKTWQITQYTPEELAQFPKMTTLGAYLGNQLAVFDMDGTTALDTLMLFLETGGYSPETIEAVKDTVWTSSDRQTRFGIWWKIPAKYQGVLKFKSIPTGDKEQLEFRNGDHYQAVAGMHPKSGMYWSNGKQPLEMPEELCELWLSIQGSDRKTSEEPKKAPEIDTTDFQLSAVQTLLGYLETLESAEVDTDDYHLWLRVGMIVHSVDDTEKGLKIWDEWSQKSQKYQAGVCEKKWASFDSEGDKLSIGSLYFWLNKESEKISDPVERKEFQGAIERVRNSLSNKWTISDTPKAIAEFKELGLSGTALSLAIDELAKDAYGSANEQYTNKLWDLYDELDEPTEEEQKSFRESYEEVKRTQNNLNLKAVDVLGDCFLAHQIDHKAEVEGENLEPGYLTTSFLTCMGSRLRKGLSMEFNQTATTVPVFYQFFVGGASFGKGEQTRDFTRPLDKLRLLERHDYEKAKKQWEEDLEVWRGYTKKEKEAHYANFLKVVVLDSDIDVTDKSVEEAMCPEPQKPTRLHVLKRFTPERAESASAEDNQFGLLITAAELVTISKGSQYKGSTQTDVDMFLEAYDGETIFTDLQTDQERPLGFWQTSLISSIQKKVFRTRFDQEDSNGFLSRCIMLPLEKPVMHKYNANPDNPESLDLQPHLLEVYQGLEDVFPGVSYPDSPLKLKNTKEAKALWIEHASSFEAEANEYMESCPAMLSWLRRQPERTARYAMVIHAFRIQQGLIEKSDRISADTMLKAIRLANYHRALMFKVYDVSKEQENPELIQLLTKLREKFIDSGKYQIGEKIKLNQSKVRWLFKHPALLAKYGSKKAEVLNIEQQKKCLNDLDKLGGFVKVGKDGNRQYFRIMK